MDSAGWDLTSPEVYVLLRGPRSDARALELAVLELIDRGALHPVERRARSGRRSVLLDDGPAAGVPPEPSLAAVWSLYRAAELVRHGSSVGVAPHAMARAARRRYGAVGRYVGAVILPALVERGLYRRAEGRLLGLVPWTRYVLTRAGQAARRRLAGMVAPVDARTVDWTSTDEATRGGDPFTDGPLMTPEARRRLAGLHNRALLAFLEGGAAPDPRGSRVDESLLGLLSAEFEVAASDAGQGRSGPTGEPSDGDTD